MIRKVGFTGTQHGMSKRQQDNLRQLLTYGMVSQFHHGDCIGADAQAAQVARKERIQIVIHPPTDSKKRAWTYQEGDQVELAAPYLIRNHEIVDSLGPDGVLIAAPYTDNEVLRSGTWATVRYAQKQGIHVILLKR